MMYAMKGRWIMPRERKIPWDKIDSIKKVWRVGMTAKDIAAAIKERKCWGGKRPNANAIVGAFHRYREELRPCELNKQGFRSKPPLPKPTIPDIDLSAMDKGPNKSEMRFRLDQMSLKREKRHEIVGSIINSNLPPSRPPQPPKPVSLPKVYGTGNKVFKDVR